MRMSPVVSHIVAVVCLVALSLLIGCGSSAGTGGYSGGTGWTGGNTVPATVDTPFGSESTRTKYAYRGNYPFISATRFFVGLIGTKTIGGKTYDIAKAGYDITNPDDLGKPETKGAVAYVIRTASTLTFAGMDDPGWTQVTLDTPVTVDLNAPIGEPRTYQGAGTFRLGPDQPESQASATLVLTVVDDAETVDTKTGTYHDTKHFKGDLTMVGEAIPDGLATNPISGEVWLHPELGVVGIKVPLLGIENGLEGETDYGPATTGMNACKKVAVLDDQNPSFELNTFDRKKVLDADKMTHAKMLLEVRYANDADAKAQTSLQGVQIQFATESGFYNHSLVESPISFFHLEELGKGYRYWNAFVDQAAKNQPGQNGIAYKITVNKTPGSPPVRVTARILYKLVP
jgi:major membrane immunogen (membrane-anchored lipoprotein)